MRKKKYSRPYRIRRKKNRSILKNRFFWLCTLIFLFFVGIFYFASFSRYFQVDGSEISGNNKVSSESLEEILKNEINKNILFFPSKSIFFTNLSKTKEIIEKKFPQIANVKIKRDFPNKISIQIVERNPVAIFCPAQEAEKCPLIDEEGIIIDYVILLDFKTPKLPKIAGEASSYDLGTEVIKYDYLISILEIDKELRKQEIGIKEFIPTMQKLTINSVEGWQIFFDPQGDISEQIFNLNALLREKFPLEKRVSLDYIDLRFGSKVFFKER